MRGEFNVNVKLNGCTYFGPDIDCETCDHMRSPSIQKDCLHIVETLMAAKYSVEMTTRSANGQSMLRVKAWMNSLTRLGYGSIPVIGVQPQPNALYKLIKLELT